MTSDRHTFFNYPFPKNLLVDIKRGYYKVLSSDGAEEVIEADNAKDALSKTKITNISKIEYMGFCAKRIVDAKELIEGNELETESQEESDPSIDHPPETKEES